jgi:hypothetical protein
MSSVLTFVMVGGVVVGVVIYAVTGAVWQAVPIGLALVVCKFAQRALETEPPTGPPKKGAKK